MTPEDAALCERLTKVESSNSGGGALDIGSVTTNWYRNPDGPAAAAAIERLSVENEALRGDIETARNLFSACTDVGQFENVSTINVYAQMREFLARTTLKGADQ